METTPENFTDTTMNWLRSFSRGSRIGLVVLSVLIGVLWVNTDGLRNQPEHCSLLGSCKLSLTECQQIELALGQAGCDGFKIQDGVVQVPVARKSEFLKILTESNSLPARLVPATESSAGLNMFQSSAQQKMAALERKKSQVEQMIGRLPFVEQAWFEMDVARSRNGFETEKYSAVISIRPVENQVLDANQVGTVRQIVSGAVASVSPEEIVITDLNAGRAYQDLDGKDGKDPVMEGNYQTASWQLFSAERRSFFEKRIRGELKDYEGITFKLEYELVPRSQTPPSRVAMLPSSQRIVKDRPAAGKLGTNGVVSVDELSKAEVPPARQEDSVPRPFAFTSDSHLDRQERVAVTVHLSAELLKRAGLGEFDANTLEKKVNFNQVSLAARVESLKSEIIEKLRPVLPASSFGSDSTFPIRFKVDDLAGLESDSILAQVQTYVKAYWSTIAVLLVGAMVLIVVGKSPANYSEEVVVGLHQPSANSAMPPESMSDMDDEKRRDAEEKLSRLIDSDPEAAAQVIKGWIRDAA